MQWVCLRNGPSRIRFSRRNRLYIVGPGGVGWDAKGSRRSRGDGDFGGSVGGGGSRPIHGAAPCRILVYFTKTLISFVRRGVMICSGLGFCFSF